MLLQPFKSYLLPNATAQITSVRLANQPGPIPLLASSDSIGQDDENLEYNYAEESGAGMGKMRFSLVKLGCWVNVDAPIAVS